MLPFSIEDSKKDENGDHENGVKNGWYAATVEDNTQPNQWTISWHDNNTELKEKYTVSADNLSEAEVIARFKAYQATEPVDF